MSFELRMKNDPQIEEYIEGLVSRSLKADWPELIGAIQHAYQNAISEADLYQRIYEATRVALFVVAERRGWAFEHTEMFADSLAKIQREEARKRGVTIR